ncbi:MAG: branched-chain amino acid ABC transporter permease [Clostridia bacterium]|nr:branched-chain amino acid ABC transporter permease [Clostridia bacterium]
MTVFDNLASTLLGSLSSISVTVLATLAVTLIFKTSYTTNFAQGIISALGSYTVMELLVYNGIPIYYGIFIGIVVGVLIGLFIDVAIFRRGRYVNAIGKQIITMGMVSILVGAIPLIFRTAGLESVNLMPVVGLNKYITFSENITIQLNSIIYFAVAVVIVAIVFLLLNFSKWGLGVRSTASNEQVAGMLGINTTVITAVSWGIAGALGAVSATMYAGFSQMSNSLFMTTIQVNAFLACILGGFATFYGPVLGAVLIPLISALIGFVAIYVPGLSAWREVLVYAVLLLLILWKPQGLFGPRAVKKV